MAVVSVLAVLLMLVGGSSAAAATPGFLRVTQPGSSAVPTQILVDGQIADSWGLNWLKEAPGIHTVCFAHVQGWTEPPCQTVTVNSDATTTVTAMFIQRGFLHVSTSPPVASQINLDGNPTDDWGTWTDIPTGAHTVCFGAVATYNAPPPCQNIMVNAGSLTNVTGTFTSSPGAPGQSGIGFLRVSSSPAVATQITIKASAGSPYIADDWGLNWLELAPGSYTVSFSRVQGWTEPAPQVVTITTGNTTVVTASFTQRGTLHVFTSPAVAGTISVDGIPRDDWGMFTDIPTGSPAVCFGAVAGYNTPACQTATVTAGVETDVTGAYSSAPPNVTVTLHGSRTMFARGETFQVDVTLINPSTAGMPAAMATATLPTDLVAPPDPSWITLDGASCPAGQCVVSGQNLTLTTALAGSASHTFSIWVVAVGSDRGCNNDSLAATATAQGSTGQNSSSTTVTLCDGGIGIQPWWNSVTRSADPQTNAKVNVGTGNLGATSDDGIPLQAHGSLSLSLHRSFNSSATGYGTLGNSLASGWSLTPTPQAPAGLYVPAGEDQLPFPVTLIGADGERSLFSLTPLATQIDVTGLVNSGNTTAVAAIAPKALYPDSGYTRICVDMVGQAPMGVHLGLWRYVEVVSGSSPCTPSSGTVTHVLGFAAERPDRTRYEFASDGHTVDLMDANGNQLQYRYVNAPGAGVSLGNVIKVFEVGSGRSFLFTYLPQEVDVVDPAGLLTKYLLDASSRLASVRNPDGSSEQYGYGGCTGSTSSQLCSITDPRGNATSFAYSATAAGPPRIAMITDRKQAATTFAWTTSPDQVTVDEGNQRTKYSAFDASGSVGQQDQIDTSVIPNVTLRSSLILRDTAVGPCRQPDGIVDHNLCRVFSKVLDGSAAAEDTSYIYDPFGDTLIKSACLVASDPPSGQTPGACGSAAVSTSGFKAEYVRISVTNTYTDAVAGNGSVISAAGPGPGGARGDSTVLFAIADHTQSLTPVGNAAGSGYASYVTALYPDNNSGVNPNLPGTATTCSSVGAPATNTGDVCGSDAPVFDGTNLTSTRMTYDTYGQALTAKTPKAIAETPSGQSVPAITYTYYQDSDRDLSGTAVAGGWLKSVSDPLGKFTAYAYDAEGHAVRKWDPDATAGHAVSEFPGGLDGTAAQGGPPTCQYGETVHGMSASEPAWGLCPALGTVTRAAYSAPWRYALAERDALGNLATNMVDGNGNVLRKRPPRGNPSSGAVTTYDIVSAYDARDQVMTVLTPVEAAQSGTPQTSYSYDIAGNQVSITDPLGNVAVARYDAVNRPVAKIWTRGPWPASVSTQPVPPGCRQSTASDTPIPSGRILCNSSQGWNGVDDPISSTDGNHQTTTMVYDGLHRQLSSLAPRYDGQFTTLQSSKTYDLNGNVTAVCPSRHYTEGAGGACGTELYDTLMTYDGLNRLVSRTTFENRRVQQTAFGYDANGSLVRVSDANAHQWTAVYDLLNRQTSVSVPRSLSLGVTTSYAYDAASHILSTSTPDGATTYITGYSYDGDGRAVDTVKGSSGGTGGVTNSIGGQNIRSRVTYDADGHTIARYSPNAFANSTAPTFAPDESFKQVTIYDADGRATRVISPRTYTDAADPIPTVDAQMLMWCPSKNYSQTAPFTKRQYPVLPPGYPSYSDYVGLCVTDYQYDAAGHQTGVTDADGVPLHTQYTDDGLKASDSGPSPVDGANITKMAYFYDGDGKVVRSIDALQRPTSYTYTADELQASQSDPPNGSITHVRSWGYDANGNQTTITDPSGNVAKQTYYTDDRVAQVMSPSDCSPNCPAIPGSFDVTSYAYDPVGNVVSMTSPSASALNANPTGPTGLNTIYTYSWDNRLKQQLRPVATDGSRSSLLNYQYNAVGLKSAQDSQLTDGTGQTVFSDAGQQTFTYYPDQRLKQEVGRDNQSTNQRTYDADGNATSLVSTNASGTQTASVTSAYYIDDRLSSTTSNDVNANAQTTAYEYYGSGKTLTRGTAGGDQYFSSNAAGLPASSKIALLDQSGFTAYWTTSLSYYSTGEVQKVESSVYDTSLNATKVINDQTYSLNPDDTLANTAVTTGSPASTTAQWTYTYDNNKRKTQSSFSGNDSSGAAVSASGSASYYPSGRLRQSVESGPGSPSPVTKTATWDRDGNRLSWAGSTFSYNADGSIAQGPQRAYSYNAARDLTQDDCGTYTYDAFDRRGTASISGGGTGCPTASSTVAYRYDALDRTVSIDTQQTGKPDNRSAVTYVGLGRTEDAERNWSGTTLNSLVLHSSDVAGNLRGVFTFAPNNLSTPSTAETASDNGQGSISTMSVQTGHVNCDAFADPFGSPEFSAGGATPCSTGASSNTIWYQGSRFDAGSGTYQFGTRTYSPGTATWSQPDGFRSGNDDLALSVDPSTRNPYSYVDGDPLNGTDPTGHGCGFFCHIGGAASGAWKAVTSWASIAWNNVTSFVGSVWSNVSAAVSGAWNFVASTVSTAYHDISQAVSRAINATIAAINAQMVVIQQQIQAIQQHIAQLEEEIARINQAIAQQAAVAAHDAAMVATGLWDYCTGSVSGAGTCLAVAGMVVAAGTGIGLIADGAITGAITSGLFVGAQALSAADGVQRGDPLEVGLSLIPGAGGEAGAAERAVLPEAERLASAAERIGGADISSILSEHVAAGSERFAQQGFTRGQLNALADNPGLEGAFRGERIDTFAKQSAAADRRLQGIQITGRFQRGADFVDRATGNWWDITTPRSWAAHVVKYGLGGTMLPY